MRSSSTASLGRTDPGGKPSTPAGLLSRVGPGSVDINGQPS